MLRGVGRGLRRGRKCLLDGLWEAELAVGLCCRYGSGEILYLCRLCGWLGIAWTGRWLAAAVFVYRGVHAMVAHLFYLRSGAHALRKVVAL